MALANVCYHMRIPVANEKIPRISSPALDNTALYRYLDVLQRDQTSVFVLNLSHRVLNN